MLQQPCFHNRAATPTTFCATALNTSPTGSHIRVLAAPPCFVHSKAPPVDLCQSTAGPLLPLARFISGLWRLAAYCFWLSRARCQLCGRGSGASSEAADLRRASVPVALGSVPAPGSSRERGMPGASRLGGAAPACAGSSAHLARRPSWQCVLAPVCVGFAWVMKGFQQQAVQ